MAQQHDGTASSTGHSLASDGWLDLHFEYARPVYTAMVQSVGFQPGWRVLAVGQVPLGSASSYHEPL